MRDAADGWISSLVDRLVPQFQAEGTSAGGVPPADQMSPEAIDKARLDPTFLVLKARQARKQAEDVEAKRRSGRRAKGIAQKGSLTEHYDQYSRKLQAFIKFFLGNPDKPQDYPVSPTDNELQNLYWIEQRSATILAQLDWVRASLAGKTEAEIAYYVSVAEKEIRKNMTQPMFTRAILKGPGRGCRPINAQTTANVERSLALAGISRVTFQWEAGRDDTFAWNSTITEQAGQAPAIIRRWLTTKSREIHECGNMDVATYNKLKEAKATKEQYQQWRKRIKDNRCDMVNKSFSRNINLASIVERKECGSDIEDAGKGKAPVGVVGDWRSTNLTDILHCLDKMVIAQAQHPKTIAANHNLYTRSSRTFKHTKGIVGVPRGLPINCYSEAYWKHLSGFEKDCKNHYHVTLVTFPFPRFPDSSVLSRTFLANLKHSLDNSLSSEFNTQTQLKLQSTSIYLIYQFSLHSSILVSYSSQSSSSSSISYTVFPCLPCPR
ncbi:hypothetical protein PTTG_26220 [Puccinia triticina 1-1 BBBD Race 1]|uniref:Uncharacterized protein n=1 Tax=Puccinia triticina (isolate 1-1 / race 1 (BBBD)) TaxID=630390 RepID=A0A180GXJ4_PUCT1|nr:hypothetical protein PTTG_26220 [Puccinia triticina 1-1 BBBD Race 1]